MTKPLNNDGTEKNGDDDWSSQNHTLHFSCIHKTRFFPPFFSFQNMALLQDDLCFILDLEGFSINKTFYVRELGHYTWNKERERHAFGIPIPYKDLSDKEKITVNFVTGKIHGLTYKPSKAEHFHNSSSWVNWSDACTRCTVTEREPS